MASKNTFVNHTMFWVVVVPFFIIFVYPGFFVDPKSPPVEQTEIEALERMGRDPRLIDQVAIDRFGRWFSDTKMIERSVHFFVSTKHDERVPLAGDTANFLGQWIRNVWLLVYRAVWRFEAFGHLFGVLIAGIVVPCFIDGMTTRQIKRYTFGYHNPVYFYTAKHATILLLGVSITIPWFPVPLTYFVWAMLAGFLGLTAWFVASNFQTGS
jgi:hypothetical protein